MANKMFALLIAMVADFVQFVLFPLFGEGFLSPANDALDIAMAFLLIQLLGWNWAFVPAFLAESVPGLTIIPTWTASVVYVSVTTPKKSVTDEQPEGGTKQLRSAPIADIKSCPTCAETIKSAAKKCRYCGHQFDDIVTTET